MIHLRIVTRGGKTERALELLERSESVCNLVYLPGTARRPAGELILADVAREDASVVISELKGARHRAGRRDLARGDRQPEDDPAAANVGVAAAYQDWSSWRGSIGQLAINLGSIIVARSAVLYVQRLLYVRRKKARHDAAPGAARGRAVTYTEEPSDDQISTLVLIFSTTASVNSVVVA